MRYRTSAVSRYNHSRNKKITKSRFCRSRFPLPSLSLILCPRRRWNTEEHDGLPVALRLVFARRGSRISVTATSAEIINPARIFFFLTFARGRFSMRFHSRVVFEFASEEAERIRRFLSHTHTCFCSVPISLTKHINFRFINKKRKISSLLFSGKSPGMRIPRSRIYTHAFTVSRLYVTTEALSASNRLVAFPARLYTANSIRERSDQPDELFDCPELALTVYNR